MNLQHCHKQENHKSAWAVWLPGRWAATDIRAPRSCDGEHTYFRSRIACSTVKFGAGCMAARQMGCYRHSGAADLVSASSKQRRKEANLTVAMTANWPVHGLLYTWTVQLMRFFESHRVLKISKNLSNTI